MVTNEQIARVLYEIEDYLEVEGVQPSRKATAGRALKPEERSGKLTLQK